jgi:hypothetical protein
VIWSYSGVALEEMEKRVVTVCERAMTTTVNDIERGQFAPRSLKRCTRAQIFFNPVDQLGNIDRLGEKWMPLDTEASFRLGFRD